jgi:hypothetical protein
MHDDDVVDGVHFGVAVNWWKLMPRHVDGGHRASLTAGQHRAGDFLLLRSWGRQGDFGPFHRWWVDGPYSDPGLAGHVSATQVAWCFAIFTDKWSILFQGLVCLDLGPATLVWWCVVVRCLAMESGTMCIVRGSRSALTL